MLLKKGILGFLDNDDQNNFFEQNIDSILEKNSRIAKYSVIKGSYTVSKSSFISEKTDMNININDPDFWQVVLKSRESKPLLLNKKI